MPDRLPIALLDDDESANAFIAEVLQGWGYTSVVFQSAHALLKAQRTQRFMAVVLDLAMPDVDGFEFLHALPDSGHTPPVVIVSGMLMPVIVAAKAICISMGVRVLGAFAKPLMGDDLAQLRKELDSLREAV